MDSTHWHLTSSQSANNAAERQCEDLVLAAKAGSHAAFGELQKIYSHRLYQRIVSITRSPEDAEDVLQDTFLRAYLALPSFEGRSKFLTWLTRIAINSALMAIRRSRSRPQASFDLPQGAEEDMATFDVCDRALNPEEVCDQKQRLSAILGAVQRLHPKLRTPIRNVIDEKHSMKELAHHLRISVASAKARLHRARKRLRDSIAPERQFRTDLIARFRHSASHDLGAMEMNVKCSQEELCQ